MRQEPVRSSTGQSFGAILRSYRADAGLTQEALAERAGLSRRGIADLERGARLAPHAHTVERLADALGLSDVERVALVAASRTRLSRRATAADSPPSATRVPEQDLADGESGLGVSALREKLALFAGSRTLESLDIRQILRWAMEQDFEVGEPIRGGLINLSDDCKRLLSIASVIGHQFELEILTEVVDLADQQVLELLEEAQRMRVIEEISQPNGVQLRFVHTLVHQTFAEDLLAARRRLIERRVQQALQRRYVKVRAERAAEFDVHVARRCETAHLETPLHYADAAVTNPARLPHHVQANP